MEIIVFTFKEQKIIFSKSQRFARQSKCLCPFIHKSQGSEFDEVLICLAEKYYEHFNRELLYTAINALKIKLVLLQPLMCLKVPCKKVVRRLLRLKRK